MQSAMKSYFRRLAEGYENGFTSKALRPALELAASIYGAVNRRKREQYETKQKPRTRLPFPVISVGNLTWGGTGKTPFVEYLAKRLSDQRKTPLVLTRGYSQDEVAQFRHHIPQAVIGVGKDRAEVAQKMAKEHPVDVAVLDDGLQHWPLERDLEIIMVNALNPFGNGRLIPRGILREPPEILSRAQIVVLSHTQLVSTAEVKKLKETIRSYAKNVLIVETYLEPLFFYRSKNRDRVMISKLQQQKVTTFSGVGTPVSFQKLLTFHHIKPTLNFEFTDHHEFTEKELEEIKKVSQAYEIQEIVTTEKDFYRCSALITKVLNPLILATKLRIKSGEEALNEHLFKRIASFKK